MLNQRRQSYPTLFCMYIVIHIIFGSNTQELTNTGLEPFGTNSLDQEAAVMLSHIFIIGGRW